MKKNDLNKFIFCLCLYSLLRFNQWGSLVSDLAIDFNTFIGTDLIKYDISGSFWDIIGRTFAGIRFFLGIYLIYISIKIIVFHLKDKKTNNG